MNILIVYAHPSQESFTFSILEKLLVDLKQNNHQVIVSDLYKKEFKIDLSLEEYNNEMSTATSNVVATDVLEEQQLLQQADCVIFLYPVWWSDCPAILKGWFDRVWSNGFAYSKTEKARILNKIKTGIALCPAGHAMEVLSQSGIAKSMRKVMLEDRMGDRFEQKHMLILAGTLKEENKTQLLSQVDDIVNLISA